MTSHLFVRAGLALIATLALGGMAIAQPVPVGGGPIGQAARQSHPTRPSATVALRPAQRRSS